MIKTLKEIQNICNEYRLPYFLSIVNVSNREETQYYEESKTYGRTLTQNYIADCKNYRNNNIGLKRKKRYTRNLKPFSISDNKELTETLTQLMDKLLLACAENCRPMILSIAIEDDGAHTQYVSRIWNAKSHNIRLFDNKIKDYLLIFSNNLHLINVSSTFNSILNSQKVDVQLRKQTQISSEAEVKKHVFGI